MGIPYDGVGPDLVEPGQDYKSFTRDPDIGAVIVGFDEHFSYRKMVKAAGYLSDPNILFIGSNVDEGYANARQVITPGNSYMIT